MSAGSDKASPIVLEPRSRPSRRLPGRISDRKFSKQQIGMFQLINWTGLLAVSIGIMHAAAALVAIRGR